MKGILKLILGMLIPLAEAQGQAMEDQDDNTTGADDLIGEGLVFIGKFAQFLLDRSNGKAATPPTVPQSLQQG
jgi:hypothetical protein